jgi:hypothetical protein
MCGLSPLCMHSTAQMHPSVVADLKNRQQRQQVAGQRCAPPVLCPLHVYLSAGCGCERGCPALASPPMWDSRFKHHTRLVRRAVTREMGNSTQGGGAEGAYDGPALPPGWSTCVSRSTGHRYFLEVATGKTQWQYPAEAAATVAAASAVRQQGQTQMLTQRQPPADVRADVCWQASVAASSHAANPSGQVSRALVPSVSDCSRLRSLHHN